MPRTMSNLTQVITAALDGDHQATEALFPLIYQELRNLAALHLRRERPGQTLVATALVHEAYLRLVGDGPGRTWEGRRHFFAAAAEAMRRILVERARRKERVKHGGRLRRQDRDVDSIAMDPPSIDVLEIDEALRDLAAIDLQAAE